LALLEPLKILDAARADLIEETIDSEAANVRIATELNANLGVSLQVDVFETEITVIDSYGHKSVIAWSCCLGRQDIRSYR
jgi:hypothetical protein